MNGLGKSILPAERSLIVTASGLPADIVNIVGQYMVETDFSAFGIEDLTFDRNGRVTNPQLREIYKEGLMSAFCSAREKSYRLYTGFYRYGSPMSDTALLLQNELRKIFDEIVLSGYRACLDKVNLFGLRLSESNLAGASLRDAVFSDLTLYKVNLSGADLSGARIKSSCLINCDLSGADLTGVKFEDTRIVGLTAKNAIGADCIPMESESVEAEVGFDVAPAPVSDLQFFLEMD